MSENEHAPPSDAAAKGYAFVEHDGSKVDEDHHPHYQAHYEREAKIRARHEAGAKASQKAWDKLMAIYRDPTTTREQRKEVGRQADMMLSNIARHHNSIQYKVHDSLNACHRDMHEAEHQRKHGKGQ